MKKYFKLLLMAVAILSLNSCDEFLETSQSVTKTSDLNGVWKTTSINGNTPSSSIDYLAIDGGHWSMIQNGVKWSHSPLTTISGDGSGEFYLSGNLGTMYLIKFTGNTLELKHNGVIRKYKLDKNAATVTIKNNSTAGGGSYTFVIYEKDSSGKELYRVNIGELMGGNGWRGPICLYTTTLYADVYDYDGDLVDQIYWTNLTAGTHWTLNYKYK